MMKLEPIDDPGLSETLGITWQWEQIERLNDVLEKHGVSSADVRRAMLEEYFFDLAVQLDGGGDAIEHEGQAYRPKLAFEFDDGTAKLVMPTDAYSLHDYTHGVTLELFEDDEQ
jgi:hypothetical protein